MDKSLAIGQLPSKEETRNAARQFLHKVEPGLFKKLSNLWIDKHDEIIQVMDREENKLNKKSRLFPKEKE
jgi:hypothetical protein